MPITFTCPHCNKLCRAPDAARGRRVKCPGCGQPCPIPAEEAARPEPPPEAPIKKKAPVEAEEPKRRRRRDEDEPIVERVDETEPEVERQRRRKPRVEDEADEGDSEEGDGGETDLLPGEKMVFKTGLHWVVFLRPIVYVVVLVVLLIVVNAVAPGIIQKHLDSESPDTAETISKGANILHWALIGGLIFTGLYFIWQLINLLVSVVAVTNKRLLIRVGWLLRKDLAVELRKVKSIHVEEGGLGRMMNFGKLIISGKGDANGTFPQVADALAFRDEAEGLVEKAKER